MSVFSLLFGSGCAVRDGIRSRGHYDFKNKKTGEMIRFDKGRPGKPGHEGKDHYHRYNPAKTGKKDWYLNARRNPVPKKAMRHTFIFQRKLVMLKNEYRYI